MLLGMDFVKEEGSKQNYFQRVEKDYSMKSK